MTDKIVQPHTHVTEDGLLVKCYHKSKSTLLSPSFWIGMTLGYPFEHALWDHVWPFKLVSAWIH